MQNTTNKTKTGSLIEKISALGFAGIIVLSLVIFLLINLSSSLLFSNVRFDLTENSIYTISDGTIATIEQLDEQMTVRMFASEELQNLPGLQSYQNRVEGLLAQLAAESDGKLQMRFIRPEPFSKEEDQAVAFGLQPTPINNQQILFGIVITNHLDKSQVIPFLAPEREPFLEYDITKAIDELQQRDRPKVGFLNYSDFAVAAPQQQQAAEQMAFQQMREQFDIVNIERNATSLPQDLDMVVVIHPGAEMSDQLVYELDQFFINDGKLIVAVDPLIQNAQPQQGGNSLGSYPASDPSAFFDAWGIEFRSNMVVADPVHSLSVSMQGPQGVQQINHPSWLQYDRRNFNEDDIVTGELNQIRVISPGAIKLKDGVTDIETVNLLTTSENAGFISSLVMSQPSPQLWNSNYKPEGEKLIAARFSGIFKSSREPSGDSHLEKTPNSSNLLVIADIDMFVDRFWVDVQNFLGQQLVFRSADNGILLINAIDNMVSSSNLISLRSRGIRDRRFDVVSELRQQASVKFQQRQKDLEERLREAEQRISELQSKADNGNKLLLGQEQQNEIQRFQQQRAKTRQELRELQLQLNRDIESLGLWLKFLNIVLLPVLLLLLAIFLPSRLGRR